MAMVERRTCPLPVSGGAIKEEGRTKQVAVTDLGGGEEKDTMDSDLTAKLEDIQDIYEVINKPSVKRKAVLAKFEAKEDGKSAGMVKEYCTYITLTDCEGNRPKNIPSFCNKVHFRLKPNQPYHPTIGVCQYLSGCRNQNICPAAHFFECTQYSGPRERAIQKLPPPGNLPRYAYEQNVLPNQSIRMNLRPETNMDFLGKFDVVMADPPWSIRQDMSYSLMADSHITDLKWSNLQTHGLIFLWTNQLQHYLIMGATGHYLNHSKEHCIVAIKGSPKLHRNLDTDVIVSQARESSQKPDEIYSLIERMCPGSRKLEIFARQNNLRPIESKKRTPQKLVISLNRDYETNQVHNGNLVGDSPNESVDGFDKRDGDGTSHILMNEIVHIQLVCEMLRTKNPIDCPRSNIFGS
eukprot:Gb_22675 [translate_table: standard]